MQLCELWGVGGYEKGVRQYIEQLVAPYADEMITDAIGNLIVLKKGCGGPGNLHGCTRPAGI